MEPLSDLGVLVVDCQTTGATPADGSVLEIGWGLARASTPGVESSEAHWIALPPGHKVTWQVRRLTGYEDSEAANALAPLDAWQRMRSAMQSAARMPAAIHFAHFELAFLRDWCGRFEPEAAFPLDTVCLHAIACHLYPDLPRRSLRALAGFLGHGVDLTRRSLGHVEATAFIWRRLVGQLDEIGVRSWEELRGFLERPRPAARSRKRRYPFSSAKYRALPDGPGVYRFVRSNGDVLYVGKAASIRKRVAGHFTAGVATTERALEMLTQVHDVQLTLTPSALEAALLESDVIKSILPPYNLQLVPGDPRTWYSTADGASVSPEADDVHRCGPFPSAISVLSYGAIRALVTGEPTTPLVRARAVGSPLAWAPDPATFERGFETFVERHSLPRAGSVVDVRLALVRAARGLLAAAKNDPAKANDEDEDSAGTARSWDPERVIRHLERGLAHGYQLMQRARWLCLVYDSAVVFAEPGAAGCRLLVVDDARIVVARDHALGEPVEHVYEYRSRRARQSAFDRSHYDRLRTLTTELKRILRDGGTAAVRVGRRRWITGPTLESLLRWV